MHFDEVHKAASHAEWRSKLRDDNLSDLVYRFSGLMACRHGTYEYLVDGLCALVEDEGKRRGIDVRKVSLEYADNFRERRPEADSQLDYDDLRAWLKTRFKVAVELTRRR